VEFTVSGILARRFSRKSDERQRCSGHKLRGGKKMQSDTKAI
jgi:hypothetical protein